MNEFDVDDVVRFIGDTTGYMGVVQYAGAGEDYCTVKVLWAGSKEARWEDTAVLELVGEERGIDSIAYTTVRGINHNPAPEFTVNPSGGKKHTGGKPTYNQVPEAFVAALSVHMAKGAEKYGFGNWRKGITQSQALEATRRHYTKLRTGEDIDPETGSSHFLAIAANAMMAWCLEQDGKLTDDRAEVYIDHKEVGK